VTGPSFTSSTSIAAPNSPVSTGRPVSRSSSRKRSYRGMAVSGRAASTKLGRRPLRASPYSVNCETTRRAPSTSARERFIFPSSSGKTRSPTTLSAIQASASPVSPSVNPTRRRSPGPISPVTRSSTVTRARETRWSTTRIRRSLPPSSTSW